MQDYQETYATFQWERPEKYNFARDVIDRWDPAKPAMLWVDDGGAEITRTFGEISEASRRLCNVLVEAGVRTGDTVIVMLPRVIPWWETFTATLRMGAVSHRAPYSFPKKTWNTGSTPRRPPAW